MSKQRSQYSYKYYLFLGGIVFLSSFIGIILLNMGISKILHPQPQAILTLGGNPQREVLAAKLARQNPQLIVWVSSGSNERIANRIFLEADIAKDRYLLDYRATDTVTNFTSLVPEFKKYQIKHLYLITSDYHMPRARAVGTIILGSQGIVFTPMEVRTEENREPIVKTIRDIGRSIIWLFSGHTGARAKRINKIK